VYMCVKRPQVFPLLIICVLFLSGAAWAQAKIGVKDVEQWGVEEISLHSSGIYKNPFTDVQIQARFTSKEKTILVAGFYDGDETWRIRFMPEQQGAWQFTTISNDPQLNNQTGSFEVTRPSSGNHGPVRVAKTFHFSYADGTPYFLLGTTLYNWLNRDEALQNETLETLSKNPFTKVRFGLFPKWYEFNRVEPASYPYVETSPLKFDLDRFNPEFFQHVERRIADLQRLGIQADIILFHPYDHLGFATMDAVHDDAYIQYVAARLSAFQNVWWTMANEYDLFDPDFTPGQKVKDWDRMFQVLENSDPYSHLRGIHNIATWYDPSKPWITHVIIQDGGGHPARRLADARTQYQKPTVVDEYGYEGDNGQGWGNLSGKEEVDRHWEITMAGGYASHGETYVHPGGVLWWAAGGDLVGEAPARLAFLRSIMSSGPFQEISPAPDIADGGSALALKGQYYLLWVESAYSRSLKATEIELEGNGPYQVELIDPWLMKTYKLGYVRGGRQAFQTMMTPSLFRFTKAIGIPEGLIAEHVQPLLAKWIGDPTIAEAPKWVPIEVRPEHYSLQFTLGELLADPRTEVLITQYFPNIPRKGIARALTLEQLAQYLGSGDDAAKLFALSEAIRKIPVQQK
jgi:Domain of unknown function (DUF5060)/Protein of unknown function (DUF4038)